MSMGLNISLLMEQKPNQVLTHSLIFRYFFVRKVMFVSTPVASSSFPVGSAPWTNSSSA